MTRRDRAGGTQRRRRKRPIVRWPARALPPATVDVASRRLRPTDRPTSPGVLYVGSIQSIVRATARSRPARARRMYGTTSSRIGAQLSFSFLSIGLADALRYCAHPATRSKMRPTRCQTDGRTDRQTDSETNATTAVGRSRKFVTGI